MSTSTHLPSQPDDTARETVRTEVLIVGAGLSGIGQAIEFTRRGIDFVVLEKAADLGGTWRDNTYPGASCDVESHLYSYARDRNPDWSSTYATQSEILRYIRDVVRRHRIGARMRFGVQVSAARWQPEDGTWAVETDASPRYIARFLVLAVGGLHIPDVPNLPGTEGFTGSSWHSARWNHDVDLTGKRIALVGVGASGVQVIPFVAAQATQLTVFQRTPPWVLPKVDVPVPAWRRRLFRYLPPAHAWHRLRINIKREKRGLGFHHKPDALAVAEPVVHNVIARHIEDPALRELVTPSYRFGCKRVLFSNDYYPTLNQPHVNVVAGAPAALKPDAVLDEAGVEHPVDVIVWATGFDLSGSYDRIDIVGADGRRLTDHWRDGMRSYQGLAVPGFPNLFTVLGPNGFVAYTSVISMIETQARYIARAIRLARDAHAIVVRPEAEERFLRDIRRRYNRSVWSVGGCHSWYQANTPAGTVLWPDSTWTYRRLLRRLQRSDFDITSA